MIKPTAKDLIKDKNIKSTTDIIYLFPIRVKIY